MDVSVPEIVLVSGERKPEATLVARNIGAGEAQLEIHLEHPHGVALLYDEARLVSLHRSLSGGRSVEVSLQFDPTAWPSTADGFVRLSILSDDWVPPAGSGYLRDWTRNQTRTRKRAIRVRQYRPALTHVAAEVLVFHSRTLRRQLEVVNEGEESLTIVQVRVPEGFTTSVVDPVQLRTVLWGEAASWPVPANGSASIVLDAPRGFTGTGEMVLTCSDGQEHRVVLLGIPTEDSVLTVGPRYVVGIDFGTAKSAVFLRDSLVEAYVKPIRYPRDSDKDYFPSAIWRDGVKPGFYCGLDAVRRAPEDDPESMPVYSMKTLLRTEDKVELGGVNYLPSQLVLEFLGYIRKGIRDELDRLGVGTARARYVFSLPVLEDEDRRRRQEELTREAAVNAGFDAADIELGYEPCCAMLYFLSIHVPKDGNARGRADVAIGDGDLVLVHDFGSGTLDLALLRIHVKSGKPEMEPLGIDGLDWGGDDIDSLLFSYLLRRENAAVPEPVLSARRRRVPFEVRNAKEALSEVQDHAFDFSRGPGEEPVRVRLSRLELESLIDVHLDRVVNKVLGLLTRCRVSCADVSYAFLAGGSSAMPIVQQKLRDALRPCPVIVSGVDDMRLAVAKGAALAHDYKFLSYVPYPVKLSVGCFESVIFAHGIGGGRTSGTSRLDISAGGRGVLKLFTEVDGHRYVLAEVPVENPHAADVAYSIDFTLDQEGSIWVRIQDPASNQAVLERRVYTI